MNTSEGAVGQTDSSALPGLTPATHQTKLSCRTILCRTIVALVSLLFFGLPALAQVNLTPSTLSFGHRPEGETSAPKAVTLANAQTVPLTISSITISGGTAAADYAWAGNCPLSPHKLGAGRSCAIIVTFTPSALGSLTASLIITDNASNSPQSVALTGTGIAPVTVSPASLTFASRRVGTMSAAERVTLVNHLNTELLFSSITASGAFAVSGNNCGSSIGAGLACTIGVVFTPTTIGPQQGTLTINDSAFGSPSLVALSGTGNDNGLTSIRVTPANPSLAAGYTQQFTATGYFKSGSTQNLTEFVAWTSSQGNVATITAGGLATGVTAGPSSISATLGGIAGSTTLTVSAPVLVSIAVTPANPSISTGSTQQFTAVGTYSDSSTQNLTSTATWGSSAAGVATISNTTGSQGLASAMVSGSTTISAASGAINGSTTLTVTAGFVLTGNLNTARFGHTATLLNNETVLIAGGSNSTALAAVELYDTGAGTFAPAGSLNTPRDYHTATLLNNGTVLLAGGVDNNGNILATAELYNPASGTFTFTGSLNTARYQHTATILNNGMVLIAGGQDSFGNTLASAELYNPTSGAFTLTGSLNTARFYHTATLLDNDGVLIAGGLAPPQNCAVPPCNALSLAAAELYNPVTGIFTPTGSLNTARAYQTATLLNNGMALLAGGVDNNGNILASAELYNSATAIFTPAGSLNTARDYHTAMLLTNGMVLIAGGAGSSAYLASAELYDPAANTFTLTGSLNTARDYHTAMLLTNGMVLIAGGTGSSGVLASVELYEPATLTPPNLGSISLSPGNPTVPLDTAQPFIATGTFSDNSTEQLASVTWSSSDTAIVSITDDAGNSGSAYALGSGSATLSACAGTVCGSTTLTVGPPALVSIAITPANGTVAAGFSLQFDAMGTYGDGSTQDLTSSVTWSSSATGVATIAAGGLATGAAIGNSTISAAGGSITGTTTVIVTNPSQLPIGTVSAVTSETCPASLGGTAAGWVTSTGGGSDVLALCYHATVSCPDMPDIGVTYGVATPSGTSLGTVVFVSASGGTTTMAGNYTNDAPFDLFHFGYQTVQFAWDSEWQMGSSSGSLKVAACRVATFLNYAYSQYYQTNSSNSPTAGMCAQGQSGGAGGLAFSLTYYGASSFLDKAVIVSGPQYANLVQGCSVPNYPPVNICPSENGNYPMGCNSAAGTWSDSPVYVKDAASNMSIELANDPPCNSPSHTYTTQDEINLTATSLVDGAADATYNYPQTAITAWECDDDSYWQNPTEAEGWLYLSQFSNPGNVAPNCNYSGNNTAFPNACFAVNRVYGCPTMELAASGYVCNGSTCPVCTGNPPGNCTCGGVACSSAVQSFAMPIFREADYEDPVNGCVKRH